MYNMASIIAIKLNLILTGRSLKILKNISRCPNLNVLLNFSLKTIKIDQISFCFMLEGFAVLNQTDDLSLENIGLDH